MKLLIITSEKLNPENIISSTFELTQAKILAVSFEVGILSVELETSLSAKIKSGLKKIFFSGQSNANSNYSLSQIIKALLFGKKIINDHVIDDIKIIEGVGFYWKSPKSFLKTQATWVKTGFNAFDKYCKENGSPDLIHAHGRFLYAGALALAIKKKLAVKYVYTEHSTFFQRGLVPEEAIPICKQVISEATIFTVVSSSLLHHVEKVLQDKFPQAKIIPNALDNIFERDLKPHTQAKKFFFTAIASIEYKKGVDILVEAFSRAVQKRGDLYLNIYGEGPMMKEIEELISKNNLGEKIKLHGRKTKQEVVRVLDESDAFVLSSREETFGVVVIEALARGIPVVATRSGGPEFIVTNECGVLVEPGNAESLANAMVILVTNYEKFNRQNIHEYALAKFGSGIFLQTMKNLYGEIYNVSNS
jgi:glycosyltransferase involved in cell wall biosynthesis